MTGPEHYANAESDLDNAARASDKGRQDDATYWLGCAQVHATLALAAATAMGLPDLPSGDWDDWSFVASAGHAGRIPGSERAVTP